MLINIQNPPICTGKRKTWYCVDRNNKGWVAISISISDRLEKDFNIKSVLKE